MNKQEFVQALKTKVFYFYFVRYLGIGGKLMDKSEYLVDSIKLDDNDRIIGCYDDYVLKPFYQPIYKLNYDSQQAEIIGYEALVRPHIANQTIRPDDFFNLVSDADALFVECLCIAVHINGFNNAGLSGNTLFVNVNVANYETLQDIEREFFFIFSQLAKHNISRENIVFEILETEIKNPENLLRLCKLIKTNGYRFALDDFGTSHSNVDRYMSVNPDIIKLDRSLLLNAMKSHETAQLLKSLTASFQSTGVEVVMEGVETEQEVLLIKDMGMDMMQGFYLGTPQRIPSACKELIDLPQSEGKVTKLRFAV